MCIFAMLGATARAEVVLSDLFADHMIFQRGAPIRIWGKADAGEKISVAFHGATADGVTASDGTWSVTLPAQAAGGPYTVEIQGTNRLTLQDILVGDVWIASGQSNMDMHLYPQEPWTHGVIDYRNEITAANHPNLRFFTTITEASVKKKDAIHGVWEVCTPQSVANFSAVAYYFAQKVLGETGIPEGVILSAVGSTSVTSWLSPDVARQFTDGPQNLEAAAQKWTEAGPQATSYEAGLPTYYARWKAEHLIPGRTPGNGGPYKGFLFQTSGLYNAMIAPLTAFPVKGFIWYQGESDATNYAAYPEKMKALINSWRMAWGEPDAPFYFVQIACCDTGKHMEAAKATVFSDNWAQERLAQEAVLEIPHTGMAVSADQGDHTTPHYANKKPVGERLALIALNKDYGQNVVYQGPQLDGISSKGNQVTLHFQVGDGALISKTGNILAGFELAGSDSVFHSAIAKIDGSTVVVSSPDVSFPAFVRYGWGSFPKMSLFNRSTLPAPSFLRKIDQQ